VNVQVPAPAAPIKRLILWLFFIACCSNILAMFVVAYEIDGDASRGKVVDGHFYALRGYMDGASSFVEVSERTYDLARWHMISAFVTAALALATWKKLKSKS
jgi:hypothetical protein